MSAQDPATSVPTPASRLPQGSPWRSALLWVLLAAAIGAALTAYLFLSGSGGVLPRPAALSDLPFVHRFDRSGAELAGIVSALAFVLVAGSAWLRHRRLMQQFFLLRSFEADPNGRAITVGRRLLYWNSVFARMMEGDPLRRFAELDVVSRRGDGAQQLALLRDIALAGGNGHAEISIPTDLGDPQWFKVSAYSLGLGRGYTLWLFEDVTTRRQMERVLSEERAKLVDFLENASIGFYSVDAGGAFDYVNQTLARWLGTTADELLHGGRHLHEFVAGPDPQAPWSPFRRGFAGMQDEVALRAADGRTFQAEIIQTVAGEAADGTLRTRSIVRDLTAERELRRTLAASEQRFRKLFEEGPTGIAILDLDGAVADCNRAFRELAGCRDGGVGRAMESLVAPDSRAAVAALLSEATARRRAQAPLDIRFAHNAEISASLSITRLEDSGGDLSGFILHLFDNTQNRRLEAQFAQSQKMQAVGQLAGGIAHDFNNLLTVMIGFCDLILQRHRPGEQTFADIMQIKQNANRAANLVRQLLAFSRQQTMQPKVLDVAEVLSELSNLLRRLIGVNITLKVVHSRDLGLVKVDQVQFEQVIINLAVNARDAMKEKGGVLTIRTSNATVDRPVRRGADVMPPGEYVRIEMADTGCGIPRENLERIFEPFFSTKEVGAGTGLGLSTVYGIVSQTGGFVQVDSEMGRGSTFSIFLPRHEGRALAPVPREAVRAPLPSRDLSGVGTVLLVEDEDPVRLFGARALRNKGYKVLEAKNGVAALDVIGGADEPIDLVISDVVMPQRDGPSLIREVRERYPGMKVIFISGYAEDDFREALQREPGIHFLPKPFSLDQLAGKVKEVLAE